MKNKKLIFLSSIIGLIFGITLSVIGAATQFTTGTIVTSSFLNSIYYTVQSGRTTGGHVHDGGSGDGHAPKIASTDIETGAVNSAAIADGTIAEADLDSDCVTGAKIANNAVTSAKINDGTINTADYGDDTVTCDKVNFTTGCDDLIPPNMIATYSEQHHLFPITGCADTSTADMYIYIPPDVSGSNRVCDFGTAWQYDQGLSGISSEYARVIYTCDNDGTDDTTDVLNITLYISDDDVGDTLSYDTLTWTSLDCGADNGVFATSWQSFTITDSQDIVTFYGEATALNNSCTASPDTCIPSIRLLGIEVKYTGTH